MYILYSLLMGLAAIFSLPWWLLQMARLGKYRAGFGERMGAVPQRVRQEAQPDCIWIHAVSVGEVLAISQLVTELRKREPDRQVFVSTTTATGQQLARQRFGEDHVFYMPLDFRFALRPYFAALQPGLVILAETELWPNLLHMAKQNGAALAVANARISDRSFPRYLRLRGFFSRVLKNVDLFLTQTEEDSRRLRAIGAPAERVKVSGNLKFDIRLSSTSPPLVAELRSAIGKDSPVIVCGSTTEGEEEIVLSAFRHVLQEFPSAVMVLAPRHPERFEKVAEMIAASGLKFLRRSNWRPHDRAALCGTVFLLDSVGELAATYALADLAFVGGSLVPLGGHNILEPAQHGIAVLTGTHTFNFREIVRIFDQGGGLRVVSNQDPGTTFLELLRNPQERERLGSRARQLFLENTGATQKTLTALEPLLGVKAARVQ